MEIEEERAQRIRQLQDAMKSSSATAEQIEELLWQAVVAFQGYPFQTATGLPFSYTIRKGRNGKLTRELWVDRRENSKSLSWSSIRLAFMNGQHQDMVERPKALGDIRGVSYIYPILWRFGLICVPEKIRQKMETPAM